MNSGKQDVKGSWGQENMTPGDQEATSPRFQQGLSSRFQDFLKPGYQELLSSGVLDLWSSWVQELMISGHQGFLTSGYQDAKTSIRIDFLIFLFHDGLSSRVIHPVSVQFCSRCRLWERAVCLFRLAGEQAGTGRNIRPVFGGQKHDMFCPRQAVFSVTRNRFRNRKQLARKGVELLRSRRFLQGTPCANTEFPTVGGFSPVSLEISSAKTRFWDLLPHKTGTIHIRFVPVNVLMNSLFLTIKHPCWMCNW